jgi:hypothetical protein
MDFGDPKRIGTLKQSIVIRAKQDFAKKFFILLNSMQI